MVRCKICLKDIDISSTGESALKSHATSQKHRNLLKSSSEALNDVFSSRDTASVGGNAAKSVDSNSSDTVASMTIPTTSANIQLLHTTANEILRSEMLWAAKVATSHYSMNSCTDSCQLFKPMFPDSKITERFSYGSQKCAYLIKFGIAPYFMDLLLKRVAENNNFVILFDESLMNDGKV